MKPERQFYGSREILLQYVWNIHETGNFIWMVKDADYSEFDQSDESIEAFNQMNREVVNRFGGGKKFMKLLKQKVKYLIMANIAISKTPTDKYLLWRADVLNAKIQKEEKSEEGDREESLITISEYVCNGRPLNPMEITYWMYHSYLNSTKKAIALRSKKQKKDGKKN